MEERRSQEEEEGVPETVMAILGASVEERVELPQREDETPSDREKEEGLFQAEGLDGGHVRPYIDSELPGQSDLDGGAEDY